MTQQVEISPRVERRYELTRLQHEVWASQRLHPNAPVANMATAHGLRGVIDPDRFVLAFDEVVRASDALRTVVDTTGSVPAGQVLASPRATTEVIYVESSDLEAWMAERVSVPIDATRCGYDSVLIRHGDDDWTWWLDLHHVVTDGISQSLVYSATTRAYRDSPPELDSFVDFAEQHSDSIEGGRCEERSVPLRPFGVRGPAISASTRSTVRGGDDRDLSERIFGKYRSLSPDLSILATCASALALAMQRTDGRSEYSVGVPVHNRSGRAAAQLVGPLMELHPITVRIESGDTFTELVNRTLAEVIAMLRRIRSGEPHARQFELVVNVFRASYEPFGEVDVNARWVRAPHVDPAHSVRLHAFEYSNGLEIELDVNDALASSDGPTELASHVSAALDAMLSDPSAAVSSVGLASSNDVDAAAALIPAVPSAPQLRPVHEEIRDALRSHPEWVVAESPKGAVTAAEFDRRVGQATSWLGACGVAPGDRVGLRMGRSIEVLVAIHAVLRSGAAFVMLDPADPEQRHATIAADAELRVIIDDLEDSRAYDPAPGQVAVGLDDIAYVLYTSGSTGLPKGVPIPHRGLADYLDFARLAYCDVDEPPVVALHSALIFDLTITSLFLSFVSSGRVIVFDGDPVVALSRIAVNDQITFLKATPSQLEIFARMVDGPRPIHTVVVGGEAFRRPTALATAFACRPGVRIFNEYGPTEAVVGCMIHRWDPSLDAGPDVPIGAAAPGCEVVVLDLHGHVAPAGSWGELWVRRAGMAREYLNRRELTEERFLALDAMPGQLGGSERGPWYRTGDRVRMERPGVTIYGGRFDDQMKVNGVRLEPAEVEAALVEHPNVSSALVRLWTPADRASTHRCLRCGLGTDVPGVELDGEQVCSVCRSFDVVEPQTEAWFRNEADLDAELARARERSTGDYDCLHLLSGGKDSSYALYQLVERGWRVHALTLDNGFISQGAKDNIRSSIEMLGITHEFATTEAMNDIFADSLDRHSNVCQGCYKTIYTMAVARADQLGIPVVVTGLSRGQFFETRLIPAQFEAGRFDPDAIDATVLEARKVYHQVPDAVTELLPEQRVFDDAAIFDRIEFVDFYRYVDVDLTELYRYLEENAPWVRPADTGRSTNCLINVAGIQVHQAERGYHNYAEPYSWDVRLGHKTREEALGELDDRLEGGVADPEVARMLGEVGYRAKRVEILTAWYQTVDGTNLDPDELRRHLRSRVAEPAVPAAFVRIDDIPLAASAKADASALPAPTRVHRQGADLVAPSTGTERALCEIWAEVLHLEHVGVTDDFFDLGGDSLAALEVVATVADTLATPLDDAAVFHARTVRELAALVDGPADPTAPASRSLATIPALDPAAPTPLSAGEEAMLFEYRRDPLDVRHNITRRYHVPLGVDVDLLVESIRDVAMLHGPLHLAFDTQRTQLSRLEAVVDVRFDPMSEAEFNAFVLTQRAVRFDLDVGPAVRVHSATVLDEQGDPTSRSVLVGMHHIRTDAAAFDVFWGLVAARYQGIALVEPSITYGAHGAWQRDAVHPGNAAHWTHERLAADELEPAAILGLAAPVPAEPDGYLARAVGRAPIDLRLGSGITPFAAALSAAAFTVALHAGSEHVELGVAASVRDHPAASSLVGNFINTLPVRLDVGHNATFAEVSSAARDVVAGLVEHRAYPYGSIVRDSRAAGVRLPQVSYMLAYERLTSPSFGGERLEQEIVASGTAVTDLTFFVQERDDELFTSLEYSGAVVSAADAGRLLDVFTAVLREGADAPDVAMASLVHTVDSDVTGPVLPTLAPTVLHEFVRNVEERPDAIAAVDALGAGLTFGDLADGALALANVLIERDADLEFVGVCVERSVDMVIAILAAQLSGAAYVALDPTSPSGRLDTIASVVELTIVLTDSDNRHRFTNALVIDRSGSEQSADPATRAGALRELINGIDAADPAYVIFTSGSTGTPRGVVVSHANLCASTLARRVAYDGVPKRFLLTSSIGFDSSIVGLFWPLAEGGTIVIPSDAEVHDVDALARTIEREAVTHLLMVPSLYRAVLTRGAKRLGGLRTAIVAGEACPPDVAALHRQAIGETELFNEYGPTEASVWSTVHRVTNADREVIPIGQPIAGVALRVAGTTGRPVPRGVAGELLVAGPTVTAGYLHDEEATADKFVTRNETRWYHTGDLVRLDESGSIDFLGRIDDQLNVGGVRLEPTEIEALLLTFDGIADAVVIASNEVRSRLIAHVCLSDGTTLDEADVRHRLGDQLPATSVPSRIVEQNNLPRTGHGKLDRRAAITLPIDAIPNMQQRSAGSSMEAAIVEIWRTVLGRRDVTADTDYFEVGGDSLAAVEIVIAIEELAGRDLTIRALLDGRTPAGIAVMLDHEGRLGPGANGRGVRLLTMQAGLPGAPVVVLTSAWDDVFGYRALVDNLPDHVRVLAASSDEIGDDDVVTTIDGLSVLIEELLVEEAPEDLDRMITVLGWSTGGVVAYDLAGRLRERGCDVENLVLVDTFFPGAEKHLWSNRWWNYKSLWKPSALATEITKAVKRRSHRYAKAIGTRLLAFSGSPVPAEPERTAVGSVPLEAFSYQPQRSDIHVVIYAASMTNPERTVNRWREVVDLEVVPVVGRHRGHQSVMGADRVAVIAADLSARL